MLLEHDESESTVLPIIDGPSRAGETHWTGKGGSMKRSCRIAPWCAIITSMTLNTSAKLPSDADPLDKECWEDQRQEFVSEIL